MSRDADLQGAFRGPAPMPISPETFDEEHAATGRSELIWRLAAEAYGDDYPSEIQAWGLTTWWVLGRCVSALRVGPEQVLVDLACGRGGPGLWLARATGAELIGVDWSLVAIEEATGRAPAFVPPDRARFLIGDLAASGLPDGCADAVVCLDAVFFAEDRIAALREVKRLIRRGGRYAFTAPERDKPVRPSDVTDWTALLEATGLEIDTKEEVPRFAEQLGRMYALWARAPRRDPGRDRRHRRRATRNRSPHSRADARESPLPLHRRASIKLTETARSPRPGAELQP